MFKVYFVVPQGSILGLLLSLIHINEFHNYLLKSASKHFAEDTNVLYLSTWTKSPGTKNLSFH